MKIAHLEASSGWGGQEIRILREAIALRNRGYEIIFVIEKNGKLARKARENRFKVYERYFKKRYWIITFFSLLYLFKKEKVDLINTHSSLDAWIGGGAAKALSLPVIRTRHLSAKVKKGYNSKIVYHYLADFVVTTCQGIIPTLCKQSKKPIELFQSIPTGINPKEMVIDSNKVRLFRESYQIKPTDCLVGMVCFMRSWKGIEDFLQAALILKGEPNLKWILIGGGHIETYIRRVKELNLEDQIIFTGHLSAPFYAIQALDIFTLLSTANEGVSQASLQAAYLKKPLITTKTGGLCEVCLDQKTGIIVPCFSPNKVADAIITLKNSSSLKEEYGERGHLLVKEKFSFNRTVDSMESIYIKYKK